MNFLNNILTTVLLLIFIGQTTMAQGLQVFPATEFYDPMTGETLSKEEYLAYSLLGAGAGGQLEIKNVVFEGSDEAVGFFVNQQDNVEGFGLGNGIILSTGEIGTAPGPFVDNEITSGSMGTAGDEDLDMVSGVGTNDACILEFDVKAFGNAFAFNYVFGSEEYDNFVCSPFNDVFAFFITGPNPAGGMYENQNIALIPGTELPVAINTVNDGVSDNPNNSECLLDNGAYYASSSEVTSFEGLTNTLTAFAPVIACEEYHLKIAIADGSDAALDSAVFLEAGSMEAKPKIALGQSGGYPAITPNSNGDLVNAFENSDGSINKPMVEACQSKTIQFDLGNIDESCILNLEISGTAENGVDFTDTEGNPIPTEILFTPAQSNRNFELIAMDDSVIEGIESIIIKVIGVDNQVCSNTDMYINTDTIYLVDGFELFTDAFAKDAFYGPLVEDTIIEVSAYGGASYTWFPAEYFDTPNEANAMLTVGKEVEYGCIISNGECSHTSYLKSFDFAEEEEEVVGLDNIDRSPIQIYPNPVSDWLVVKSLEDQPIHIVVYDQKGMKVMESNAGQLDFSAFDNGLYFVRIEMEGKIFYEKIVR